MIVIDATNLILGRMSTFAAKQALLGKDVRIINAEKAIISGSRARTLADVHQARERGIPTKGPFIPRVADRFVRRTIRGMLPHKTAKGADAYKRVLCYKGVPVEFKDIETLDVPNCSVEKLPTLKYVTVDEAVRFS